MNKKLLIFFLMILSVSLYLVSTQKNYPITPLTNFDEFSSQKVNCPDTLILFDIDDTVIYSENSLNFSLPFRLRLLWHFPQFLNTDTWEKFYSILWQQTTFKVTDPSIVSLINDLQSNSCIVLGLTSMESGSYGIINDMPQWRFDTLSKLNIQFSQKFGNYSFDHLPSYRDNYPVLYKGILCANQSPKGEVLKEFLKQFKFHPKRIIFFDDDYSNLKSVAKTCEQLNIKAILYKYIGAEKLTPNLNSDQMLEHIKHTVSLQQ